jgi:hypothetical protein
MKKYTVRIGCAGYQDIEVEANNQEEAKEEALNLFNCPTPEGEFIEFIK